jgi:hypothetical protein
MKRAWLVLALGCLLAGCSDDEDASSQSTLVGGPCGSNEDCDVEAHCERGGDFPDGLCTLSCGYHEDCPLGSRCINDKGGICMVECSADADCRGGYKCKDADNREGGKSLVCKK